MASAALHYGSVGGAAAWLVLHACYLLFGGWATHRALLPGRAGTWLREDVGPPLMVTALLGLAGHWLLQSLPRAGIAAFAVSVVLCILAWLLIVAASPRLRQSVATQFIKSAA
jgi:hypothetical protein